jgi:hypothetical protein
MWVLGTYTSPSSYQFLNQRKREREREMYLIFHHINVSFGVEFALEFLYTEGVDISACKKIMQVNCTHHLPRIFQKQEKLSSHCKYFYMNTKTSQ